MGFGGWCLFPCCVYVKWMMGSVMLAFVLCAVCVWEDAVCFVYGNVATVCCVYGKTCCVLCVWSAMVRPAYRRNSLRLTLKWSNGL